MTFEDDEVRERFHKLPAQQQYDYCLLEIAEARKGKQLHITEVTVLPEGEGSEVFVRIDEKF